MSRSRDISIMLGATEVVNTSNAALSTGGSGGIDSASVISLVDSSYVSSRSAAGVSSYATINDLPASNLTSGDQAFVSSNNRLYISNGSGWYNVALINSAPTMSLDQSGTITLTAESLTSTVTITAQDSDNPDAILTYSVESDGNMLATGVTVSQDSSVFTITSLTEDSGGVNGSFNLTFKVTDQINQTSESLSFTLQFTNIIDSSAETVLLMKAAGNSATNAAITYLDSSQSSTGFTETGNPQASTFSPYRSGGYSTQFADGVAGNLNWSGTYLDSDYTIEAWINTTEVDGSGYNNIISDQSSNVQLSLHKGGNGIMYTEYQGAVKLGPTSSGTGLNEWAHFVWEREGTTLRHYVNGALLASATVDNNAFTISKIGQYYTGGYEHHGYIRDLRVLKTAKYGGSSYTVPTSTPALSDDATTQFIACHLPYIEAEGVSISRTGATFTSTKPFGPYDFEPWTADNHVGSVYFDGSGDKISTPNSTAWDLSSGSWTIECWVYLTGSYASKYHALYAKRISGGGATTSIEGYIKQSTGALSWFDGTEVNSTGIIIPNTWSHCAWVHDGTNLKMFLNGKNVYNAARSVTERDYPLFIGGLDNQTAEDFEGSISDFRITKGTAKYSANFTPPTAPLSHDGSTTKMLMNNKSDANIYDAAAANTFSLIGDVASSTTQRKFSTSSSILINGDGSRGVKVIGNRENVAHLGSADFTLEGWVYFTGFENPGYVLANRDTNNGWFIADYAGTLKMYASSDGSTWNVLSNKDFGSCTLNTWHHFAAVRDGTNIKLYLDGVLGSTTAVSTTAIYADASDLTIGYYEGFTTYNMKGYLQDVRITKGLARYTTAFTPPTAEFEL